MNAPNCGIFVAEMDAVPGSGPEFLLEIMARLPGRLQHNQGWLPLAFKFERMATISELGMVGDVVVFA